MVGHTLIGAYEHMSLAFRVDLVAVGTRYHQPCSEWRQKTLPPKEEILILIYSFAPFT